MAKVLPSLSFVALVFAAVPVWAQSPGTNESAPSAPPAPPSSTDTSAAPATPAAAPAPDAGAPAAPPPVYPPPSTPAPAAPPPAPGPAATAPPPVEPAPEPAYSLEASSVAEPPPPSEPSESKPFEWPEFSVRVDPLNWLLEGRLGFEFEAQVWRFITVETIPVFVADEQPPLLNLGGIPDTLRQKSNGLGALSGASLGVGFWLNDHPFRGTVLRFYYTNYGYKYEAADGAGAFDSVKHTERRLVGMLGSHSKWGAFTIATGIGLGVEMNRERRCVDATTGAMVTKGCSDDEILIRVERDYPTYANVTGGFHPVYLLGRLSLGVVF